MLVLGERDHKFWDSGTVFFIVLWGVNILRKKKDPFLSNRSWPVWAWWKIASRGCIMWIFLMLKNCAISIICCCGNEKIKKTRKKMKLTIVASSRAKYLLFLFERQRAISSWFTPQVPITGSRELSPDLLWRGQEPSHLGPPLQIWDGGGLTPRPNLCSYRYVLSRVL